jgi:hypothetical protein
MPAARDQLSPRGYCSVQSFESFAFDATEYHYDRAGEAVQGFLPLCIIVVARGFNAHPFLHVRSSRDG